MMSFMAGPAHSTPQQQRQALTWWLQLLSAGQSLTAALVLPTSWAYVQSMTILSKSRRPKVSATHLVLWDLSTRIPHRSGQLKRTAMRGQSQRISTPLDLSRSKNGYTKIILPTSEIHSGPVQ